MTAPRWALLSAASLAAGLSALLAQDAIPFGPPAPVVAVAAGSETTPATIFGAKLVRAYRADTNVTGSSPITAWAGMDGAGECAASNTPTLATDANGVAYVDIDSGDYFSRTITDEPTGHPVAFYAVFDQDGTLGKRFVCLGDTSGDGSLISVGTTSAPRALATVVDDSGTTDNATHGTTLSTGTRYVCYASFASTTSRVVNVDALTEVSDSTSRTITGNDRLTLCSLPGGSSFAIGKVYELVILNDAPTAGEHAAYLAYCDARYDIPGLP